LGDINSQPPTGCTINLPNESDINNWEITMQGPAESVYEVRLKRLPSEYRYQYLRNC
jgi:ubiquitin-protein ligase